MGMPRKLLFNPQLLVQPTDQYHLANKAYVDGILAANDAMAFKGGFDASTATEFPAGNAGDAYKVTATGTVDGIALGVGDMIICTVDATVAGTTANWLKLQSQLDAASTTVAGFVELATSAEAEAKTDATRAVTPASLANFALVSQIPTVPSASTTVQGIVELATSAEAEAKTDSTRAVTPASLANFAKLAEVDDQVFYQSADHPAAVTVPENFEVGKYLALDTRAYAKGLYYEPQNNAFNMLQVADYAISTLSSGNTTLELPYLAGRSHAVQGSGAGNTTITFAGRKENCHGLSFLYSTGLNNSKLVLAQAGHTFTWINGVPPCDASVGTSNANEWYKITIHIFSAAISSTQYFLSWEPIGHGTGVVTPANQVLTGSGSPNGVITSAFKGQIYVDGGWENAWVSGFQGSNTSWNPVGFRSPFATVETGSGVWYTSAYEFAQRDYYAAPGSNDLTITFTEADLSRSYDIKFYFHTGAGNYNLNITNTNSLSLVWENNSPPPCFSGVGTANADELYQVNLSYNVDGKIVGSWKPIGHSTGVYTPAAIDTQLEGYQKTVYRTVTAASSGTILGSATGIANKYVQVSAYEDGTPNTTVGIDYTVAANGDISWSTASAFTGFIVVSGCVTPVSV